MSSLSKARFYSRKSTGVLLLVGVLAGVAIGGSVSAAPTTKVTWKVSSLQASQVKKLSAVVSTNSKGMKTWLKKGTCTLTPKRKPTKVTMGATGTCQLTLKIAKSGAYPARTSKRTVNLAAGTAIAPTTTVALGTAIAPATTAAPPTTAAPGTATAPPTTAAPATTAAPTTTVALTCATGGTCVVGNAGPGGGTVYFVASSNFTSAGSTCGNACRYLEVAAVGWITASTPAGQTNCPTPGTISADPKCVWSGNNMSGDGPTDKRIGAGFSNTSAIIAESNGGNTAGKAATVARAFQGGDKTDWFLPSTDELNALCKWAYNDTVNVICNDDGEGSMLMTNGGFDSGYYWTSSQNDWGNPGFAGTQAFNSGDQNIHNKYSSYYVRPVRAF